MIDLRRLTILMILAIAVAACTGSTASGSIASARASQAPVATSAATTGPGGTAVTGQTDTEWGRIWDALPTDFPLFPGSTPSDEASSGAASATLVVDGDVAKVVATTIESKLKAAGWTSEGVPGPLEDGTYTLEMTGSTPGCRVSVTAQPTGSLTTVTILYGSACPAP